MWPFIAGLYQDYQTIHDEFRTHQVGEYAFTGNFFGPFDDHDLSRAVDFVSQELWDLYKQVSKLFGLELFGFDTLAGALKEKAIEIQIGPPRELYYTMPSPSWT
jgi:hypothetical protein